MWKALAPVAVALALLVAGCGSSGDQTATIGTSEVTISGDEDPQTFSEVVGLLLDKTPYQSWYSRCLEGEIEKRLSDAEEDELLDLSKAEAEGRLTELMLPAGKACQQEGRRYIDPNASAEELDLLRSSEQTGLGLVLRQQGASASLVACLERGVGNLPNDELVELIEGSLRTREALLEGIGEGCEGQS
jgi:hypothetical protein